MIGMYSEGALNLIAVPVSYYEKPDSWSTGWWWYEQRSAVGLMRWDLSLYDPALGHLQQKVLTDLGTFLHPSGEVRRSIFFKHQSAVEKLMMITLSETHLALTDLSDLAHPTRLSEVEVAPFVRGLYQLAGGHVVEAVCPSNPHDYYYSSQPQRTEFRVKKSSAPIEEGQVLASFAAGGVTHVMPHKQNLVLFRPSGSGYYWGGSLDLLVFDLSNPLQPKQSGTVALPFGFYDYWWGWGGWYRSSFSSSSYGSWVPTESGLAALRSGWDSSGSSHTTELHFVDLSDPAKPKHSELALASAKTSSPWSSLGAGEWEYFGVVAADDEPDLVYVTARKLISEKKVGEQTIGLFKYYALAYRRNGGSWVKGEEVNVPGLLRQAYAIDGKRVFLTSDRVYEPKTSSYGSWIYWQSTPRLHLLRRSVEAAAIKAALQDSRLFQGWELQDMVRGGSRLFVNAMPTYDYASGSNPVVRRDRLSIFELGGMTLQETFAASTGTYYSQLMRLADKWLFVYLPGDGLLIVDTASADEPVGAAFVPTEDRISHVEVVGTRALLAGGHRGVLELELTTLQMPATN
jgi:hypothetical protein